MEQLNKVYTTFHDLEKNYRRSKKSRREYLVDKFGGDIEIGMMVILDFFVGATIESDDDIKKLSFIKDVFAGIKKNIGNLDTLDSFDALLDEGDASSILMLLDSAAVAGAHISTFTTAEMYPTFHYKATAAGLQVVPILQASRVKVFNDAMRQFVQSVVGPKQSVEIGQVYDQKAGGLMELHVYG